MGKYSCPCVCIGIEFGTGKRTCPCHTADLVFEELEGGTSVNILNSSLEQILGLLLGCALSSSLPGCLSEVGNLCPGLL